MAADGLSMTISVETFEHLHAEVSRLEVQVAEHEKSLAIAYQYRAELDAENRALAQAVNELRDGWQNAEAQIAALTATLHDAGDDLASMRMSLDVHHIYAHPNLLKVHPDEVCGVCGRKL